MKRPLVILTIVFCLGISATNFIKIPFGLVYGLAIVFLVSSILSLKKRFWSDIFLFILFFLLGVSLSKTHQILPKCHIRYINYDCNRLYEVKGTVVSEPFFRINKTSFIFRAKEIGFGNIRRNCCGDMLVYIKGRQNLHCAEELILTGSLRRPFKNRNSKKQSYRQYLYNQGIFYVLLVKSASYTQRLHRNQEPVIKRFVFWLKAKIEKMIFEYLAFIPAGILDAMILGEKRNIPQPIYNSMVKSGTVHILVVSGFNTGIVAFIIVLFLRLLRLPRRLRIYIAIPLLILYCLVTGASNPVVRATVMAIVFMFAYLFKRESDIYNSCALAAMFILISNPRQLFDVGFQLSFVSVISIVYLYPKITTFLHLDKLEARYIKFLISGCLVSLSAWVGTMGFIAYYFRIFSPVTVLANIFIVPLATLITLCGFILIFTVLIFPCFAPIFAYSIEILVALLLNINNLLIKLPGAYFCLP